MMKETQRDKFENDLLGILGKHNSLSNDLRFSEYSLRFMQ